MTMVAAVLVACVYLMFAPKMYTSSARLAIRSTAPSVMGQTSGASWENFLATQGEWISSSTILGVAASNPGMEDLSIFDKTDNRIKALKDGLSVEVGSGGGKAADTISVSFTSASPTDSMQVVNYIVDAYSKYQSMQRKSQQSDLEKTKELTLKDLDSKYAAIQQLSEQYNMLSPDGKDTGNVMTDRISSLATAAAQAHLETINSQGQYESAQERLASEPELAERLKHITPTSGLSDSAQDVTNLTNEMSVVRQRISDMRQQYMSDHPQVIAQQARLDQLMANYLATIKAHWQQSLRHEEQLNKALTDAKQEAIQLDKKSVELRRLVQERQHIQDVVDQLDKGIKDLTVADGTTSLNIGTLETAKAELTPSSPRKGKVVAIALAMGLLGGMGLTVLLEFRDQRMRSADEVRASLGVAVLGVIPQMQAALSSAARGTKVQTDPTSDIAEAYRTVRTSIYFGLPHESLRTILISSPLAGDGKSTLISNLAIAMAQAGRRVLVVDADLRMPTQHKIFDVESGPGFSGVLQGLVTVDNAIVHTGVDGLDLLPCGPLPRNPAEALNSQSFADVLADLATRYDHVLLDSPAMMAVADARICSAWCDATVLVLHGQRSSRRMARMARDGLIAVGANLVGVVVNDVTPGSDKHSFYADFGYGPDRDVPPEGKSTDLTRETAKRLGESMKSLRTGPR